MRLHRLTTAALALAATGGGAFAQTSVTEGG